jgi:hypothetical protein
MSVSISNVTSAIPNGAVIAAALMAIQMRNLDAMVAAQKAALEGFGAFAKQQQETIGSTLRSATGTSTTVDADPRTVIVRPIDALKRAMIDNSANSNVLSELAARSSANVADILQKRMMAALDELRAALLEAMPLPKA